MLTHWHFTDKRNTENQKYTLNMNKILPNSGILYSFIVDIKATDQKKEKKKSLSQRFDV